MASISETRLQMMSDTGASPGETPVRVKWIVFLGGFVMLMAAVIVIIVEANHPSKNLNSGFLQE